MSNYAAIVGSLTISGSTKSDGTVNAGGSVFAYLPDTLIPVSIYANADASTIVTQPIVLDNGGRIPRANYPDGLFVTQPIRLLIQDSAGSTVSDSTYVSSTAGATGVNNDGFPSATTMDQVLTLLATTFGGEDGQFLESAGGTERTIHDKFTELWVSVKDFGAKGDGIATDTTAIQSAASRVKALGGGVCYFPPGTYLIDQAIALTSAVGVTFLGVRGATLIKSNNATANVFTFATAATACSVEGIAFQHTGTTTGAAISAAAATNFAVRDISVIAGDFDTGVSLTTTSDWLIQNSNIYGINFGVKSNVTVTAVPSFLVNSDVSGATAAVSLANTGGGNYSFIGGGLSGAAAGILFGAAFAGKVKVFGCLNTAATAYDMTALTTSPFFEQWGAGVDGYTVDVTSGATVTPNLARGNHIRVRGTTTGANYVVAAPIPTPPSSTTQGLYLLYLSFFNNTGGPITGYTFNATYHLETSPSLINGDKTNYILIWEGDIGVWRQLARSVTT